MNNQNGKKETRTVNPFIGISFKCCNVYSRIYLNKKKDAFIGWCPKCAAQARVNVSTSGNNNRFFTIE